MIIIYYKCVVNALQGIRICSSIINKLSKVYEYFGYRLVIHNLLLVRYFFFVIYVSLAKTINSAAVKINDDILPILLSRVRQVNPQNIYNIPYQQSNIRL